MRDIISVRDNWAGVRKPLEWFGVRARQFQTCARPNTVPSNAQGRRAGTSSASHSAIHPHPTPHKGTPHKAIFFDVLSSCERRPKWNGFYKQWSRAMQAKARQLRKWAEPAKGLPHKNLQKVHGSSAFAYTHCALLSHTYICAKPTTSKKSSVG